MEYNAIYLFIIWSEAMSFKGHIIDDVKCNFDVIKTFNVHWDEDKYLENYTVFYAHSQKHLDKKNLISLLTGKINHCGTGTFTAIVFRDNAPKMELRETSSGPRIVNSHVFDKKTEYRTLTGGGHRIHGSDDAWETNKDLTLLFGLNTEDFLKKYHGESTEEQSLSSNCIGVGGYKSIQQLFYVLNNTIRYVVMRNHECIPNEYTVDGHGDIDLLVENKNYISYLTLAEQVFEESYRVYSLVSIADEKVPFDFRNVGDNYYDNPWEENILKNRVFEKDLFYIPNNEDQFYSLLYHAYIQKHEVKKDYLPKLSFYGKRAGIEFNPDKQRCIDLLDAFMKQNGYEYIRPNDLSVVYNEKSLQLSNYALRYGHFIKRVDEDGTNGYVYSSWVYEKHDSFVKIGTKWIIENEVKYLKELSDDRHFPKLLSYEIVNSELAKMEISRVRGVDFDTFFRNAKKQRWSLIKSFIKEALSILERLDKSMICHRDFLPPNLIIEEKDGRCYVGLIDFGWAVHINDSEMRTPQNLGGHYRSQNGYSDLYTLGSMLLEYWYDVTSVRRIALLLQKHKTMQDESRNILLAAKKYARKPHTPIDELRLLMRRHLRLATLIQQIKKIVK